MNGKARTFQDLDRQGLVVMLIDMQTSFVRYFEKRELERIVSNQVTVLQRCREENIPVVVLEYAGFGVTIDELAHQLADGQPEPIIKEYDDGFTNSQLTKILREFEAKTIFLMGINSDACVLKTAQSAIRFNFNIATSEDVISSPRNPREDMRWYSRNAICVRVKARPRAGRRMTGSRKTTARQPAVMADEI